MERLTDAQVFAQKLAEALGAPWQRDYPKASHATGRIIGPDGLQLNVYVPYQAKDRAEIYGTVPALDSRGAYVDHGIKSPRIGVSKSRDIEAVARDVERRLFPEYKAAFEKALEAVGSQSQYRETKARLTQTIAQAFPSVVKARGEDQLDVNAGEVWGTVKVSEQTSSLELRNLTFDQLTAILSALED